MKLFRKLRYSHGEKMLTKKAKLLFRQTKIQNFITAKTAGILFDAGNSDDLKQIKEFGKFLANQNIECTVVGYIDTEIISDEFLFLGNISVFCQKDLDFFFRPSHPDALTFMSKKFDMLFDLSLNRNFPIRHIASLSPSTFKIGQFSDNDSIHDLMIDIRSKPNLEFLIEQIKNYVSILNNQPA